MDVLFNYTNKIKSYFKKINICISMNSYNESIIQTLKKVIIVMLFIFGISLSKYLIALFNCYLIYISLERDSNIKLELLKLVNYSYIYTITSKTIISSPIINFCHIMIPIIMCFIDFEYFIIFFCVYIIGVIYIRFRDFSIVFNYLKTDTIIDKINLNKFENKNKNIDVNMNVNINDINKYEINNDKLNKEINNLAYNLIDNQYNYNNLSNKSVNKTHINPIYQLLSLKNDFKKIDIYDQKNDTSADPLCNNINKNKSSCINTLNYSKNSNASLRIYNSDSVNNTKKKTANNNCFTFKFLKNYNNNNNLNIKNKDSTKNAYNFDTKTKLQLEVDNDCINSNIVNNNTTFNNIQKRVKENMHNGITNSNIANTIKNSIVPNNKLNNDTQNKNNIVTLNEVNQNKRLFLIEMKERDSTNNRNNVEQSTNINNDKNNKFKINYSIYNNDLLKNNMFESKNDEDIYCALLVILLSDIIFSILYVFPFSSILISYKASAYYLTLLNINSRSYFNKISSFYFISELFNICFIITIIGLSCKLYIIHKSYLNKNDEILHNIDKKSIISKSNTNVNKYNKSTNTVNFYRNKVHTLSNSIKCGINEAEKIKLNNLCYRKIMEDKTNNSVLFDSKINNFNNISNNLYNKETSSFNKVNKTIDKKYDIPDNNNNNNALKKSNIIFDNSQKKLKRIYSTKKMANNNEIYLNRDINNSAKETMENNILQCVKNIDNNKYIHKFKCINSIFNYNNFLDNLSLYIVEKKYLKDNIFKKYNPFKNPISLLIFIILNIITYCILKSVFCCIFEVIENTLIVNIYVENTDTYNNNYTSLKLNLYVFEAINSTIMFLLMLVVCLVTLLFNNFFNLIDKECFIEIKNKNLTYNYQNELNTTIYDYLICKFSTIFNNSDDIITYISTLKLFLLFYL